MCIIAYKPAGTAFPTWDTLENCFNNNPDGAGFMYADQYGVHVRKGFMKWKDFKQALLPHIDKGADLPFVLHFRITTHGGTKPEMTQPFPLSTNVKKLKELSSNCNVGVAHNGIIPMTSDAKKISDTAQFVKDYLTTLIANNPKYYRNPRIAEIVEELINSKMCILSNDGHVEIVGNGWNEKNGIYYSNYSYEPTRWTYTSFTKTDFDMDSYRSWWYDDGKYDDDYDFDETVECYYNDTGLTTKCSGCKNERFCFEY